MKELVDALNEKNKNYTLRFIGGTLAKVYKASLSLASTPAFTLETITTPSDGLSVIPESDFQSNWSTIVTEPLHYDLSVQLENMASTVANMIVSQLTGGLSTLTLAIGTGTITSVTPVADTVRGDTV